MQQTETCVERPGMHVTEQSQRAEAIRARLPGQVLAQRVEAARLRYGALYTLEEVRRRAAETLSMRVGYSRSAVLDRIEAYRELIPDDALFKYDDAVQSGLFSSFWVVTPAYRESRQADPWIVGEVTSANLYAIVAQWA